jgi:hypothetical protein
MSLVQSIFNLASVWFNLSMAPLLPPGSN